MNNSPSVENFVELLTYFSKALPPKGPVVEVKEEKKEKKEEVSRLRALGASAYAGVKRVAVPVGKVIFEKFVETATRWAFGVIFGAILSAVLYKSLSARMAVETIKKISESPDLKTILGEAVKYTNTTFSSK